MVRQPGGRGGAVLLLGLPGSRVLRISRYGEAGHEIYARPVGTVMTLEFDLDGRDFTALKGGPVFTFNEALSLLVLCDSQDEVDHYWERQAP